MPLEGVYNFLNSKKFKFISGLIIAINGYLIYCFGSDDQKRLLKTNLGKLGEFIISYSGWVVFISLLVGGILPILISWLQEKVEKQNLASSYSLVGEFKHEVRQFQKPYDNQQAEQISLMV